MSPAALDIAGKAGILQGHLSGDSMSSENTRKRLGKEKHLESSS